ncbi:hypothetical protein EDD70_2843 [Hydrogenoanaerobacterium saccharovorans]|uniref:SipW-cognate class signal peptide n=1 Tax=Hydrogenoanaerobacterium saccharovorans TaxID=474960 RepID=A0A1H8E4B1_9FIRM|nr:hypothetical protein [Hydrogenoanaerobacterium saccharovorans]RPF42100.1 hypothetical protein EDD70_2843 [Hydrogenoanaerobacterium saccharovorans]SEN13628.1 hypothetical protein SAMN05216180_2859 [Hydrogenoanaerobacterium saccharovorans]
MKNIYFKRITAIVALLALVISLGTMNVFAVDNSTKSSPVVIGEFDGLLSDCLNSNESMPHTLAAVANVRINSYATYDKDNGIQVKVKLYVPFFDFPKPKFTSMSGTVTVDLNNDADTTSFFETANEESTIESDVDTGVKGNKGDKGTVSVSGVATASNALAGGGAFAISYPVTIP